MKPLLNVRLVQFYNANGPLQLNVCCVNCLSGFGTLNLQDIVVWAENHQCPKVIPLTLDENGTLNLSDLIAKMERKPNG